MPQAVFSEQQLIVLDALAVGASITQAAAEAGVHRNTIANWRRETVNFEIALNNATYERTLYFREKAEELTQLAFDTIRAILDDPKASPSIRLKAALAIVNLATTQMPPQAKTPAHVTDYVRGLTPKRNPAVHPEDPQPEKPQNLHNSAQSQPLETVRREGPKVGRNESCPCGSGLKYKRCCSLASAA
jgi:preprotein translocase subunit SecA